MRVIPWQEVNRRCLPSSKLPLIVFAHLAGEIGTEYWHLLTESEKGRAGRLKSPLVAERWVIARGILRLMLGQVLQIAPKALRFEKNRYQKPYLSYPVDSNLSFNLSHSGEILLIALIEGGQIGVDVEQVSPDRNFSVIAPLVFSQGEQALLSNSSNPLRDFYALWTAKEAILKAVGCGFKFPARQLSLTIKNHVVTLLNLPPELSKDGVCRLIPFQPVNGYAAAVALLNDPLVSRQATWITSTATKQQASLLK